MKRILIVDDAGTVRMYLKKILEKADFMVEEAVNGFEALEKATSNNFDLYIVDINMPILDGYSFLKELRSSEELKQVPVVIVSTEADERDKEQAILLGANFYLVKPVKPEEFVKICKLLTGVQL